MLMLVTALEARVDDLSLEFVQQSLIHEEQKQKSDITIVSQVASGSTKEGQSS